MLIRNAEIRGFGPGSVRVELGRISQIGELVAHDDELTIDANGGALLPGLHDHHIHLSGLAVRSQSVMCGPPQVNSTDELKAQLQSGGQGWIRGIGFHESVTGGLPTARELDQLQPERPLRMQHRSGRMWLLNSLAIAELLSRAAAPPGLERDGQTYTGRLFDEDAWLRAALGSSPPDYGAVSAELARFGVTGITDMSPGNGPQMAAHFAAQIAAGSLNQQVVLAGSLELAEANPDGWRMGPAKLHLHEAALPAFDDAAAYIMAAHGQSRPVAIHCVSEVELVFALAALEEAGTEQGDRIEHASVASPELADRIAALGLAVCVQPHFVTERGDRYLQDVEPRHHGDLYRLQSLADRSIALSGGSDAPFGSANPWNAIKAATMRQTDQGQVIGPGEALSADDALALFLADPQELGRQRTIAPGTPADLCLLDVPWRVAQNDLDFRHVAATWRSGRLIHNGIDQAPGKRGSGRNPLA